MQAVIAKMRADWVVVEEDRRACGDWSDADVAEIGAAVKEAVASQDASQIALWARWLADLSSITLALKVAGITTRIRDQVRQQRERAST